MEGVLGDGLEGNFWEEGLALCVQSKFECLHGCSGHNILWQLVPVWDYSVKHSGKYRGNVGVFVTAPLTGPEKRASKFFINL